jgi:preprotein translocase subunit SecA
MRPFDGRILGAIAMADGRIAVMQTGDGKTLAVVMPWRSTQIKEIRSMCSRRTTTRAAAPRDLVHRIAQMVRQLHRCSDLHVDEHGRNVLLTSQQPDYHGVKLSRNPPRKELQWSGSHANSC